MVLKNKKDIIYFLVKSDTVHIFYDTNIVQFLGLTLEGVEFKLKREDIVNLIDVCDNFNFNYTIW